MTVLWRKSHFQLLSKRHHTGSFFFYSSFWVALLEKLGRGGLIMFAMVFVVYILFIYFIQGKVRDHGGLDTSLFFLATKNIKLHQMKIFFCFVAHPHKCFQSSPFSKTTELCFQRWETLLLVFRIICLMKIWVGKGNVSVSNTSLPVVCFTLAFQQFDHLFWNTLARCLLFTVVCSLHIVLLICNKCILQMSIKMSCYLHALS